MDMRITAFSASFTPQVRLAAQASLFFLRFYFSYRVRVRYILLMLVPSGSVSRWVYSVFMMFLALLEGFRVTLGFFFSRLMEDWDVETSGLNVHCYSYKFSLQIFFFQSQVWRFMWSIRNRSSMVKLPPYLIWILLIFWFYRKVYNFWHDFSRKELASLLEEASVLGRNVNFYGVGDLRSFVTLSLQRNWKLSTMNEASSWVKYLLSLCGTPVTTMVINSFTFSVLNPAKVSLSPRTPTTFWANCIILRSTLKISSKIERASTGFNPPCPSPYPQLTNSSNSPNIFLSTRQLVFLFILGDIIESICLREDSTTICSFSCLRRASSQSKEPTSVFLMIDLERERILGLKRYSYGAG